MHIVSYIIISRCINIIVHRLLTRAVCMYAASEKRVYMPRAHKCIDDASSAPPKPVHKRSRPSTSEKKTNQNSRSRRRGNDGINTWISQRSLWWMLCTASHWVSRRRWCRRADSRHIARTIRRASRPRPLAARCTASKRTLGAHPTRASQYPRASEASRTARPSEAQTPVTA